MSEFEFTFGGRRYSITAPFDAGAALSAAKRLHVLAAYLDGDALFAGDPTHIDDGWRLSNVLSRVERSNDNGTLEPMAHRGALHEDLYDVRDAVSLFEHAASCVARAQLEALPVDFCGNC